MSVHEVTIKLGMEEYVELMSSAAAAKMSLPGYIEDQLRGARQNWGFAIPTDEVRHMVFKGLPEVFKSKVDATDRASELAREDRDCELYTVAVTCEALLANSDVFRDMGVQVKKLANAQKEWSE